jgi:hypothetical protein
MALNLGSVSATVPSCDMNAVIHAEPSDAAYPRCRGTLASHSLVVRLLPHADRRT